ncbi:MAG TPA: transcriptional regulator GcvA [Burkholderiales bacterium]|nr:transcriptional regulator GcvA [Burkholderiales bacterium]
MDTKAHKASRLPPLNALRAFEAAARLGSFALAAKELHVTPAAISHQIKGLEDHLGRPLFRRLKRGLELTRGGQALLPRLSEGFGRLADAIDELRAVAEEGTLAVSVATSLASRWLAPRLHRFVGAHPDLDVRIHASTRLIDPKKGDPVGGDGDPSAPLEDADIAVRFGAGEYPGYRVDKLRAVAVTPMCSPKLLQGERPLRAPADLASQVLIHDNVTYDDGGPMWPAWLKAAGVEGVDTARGLHFSHAMLALEAAADGMGVALSMPVLGGSDLASGRLVAPFALALPLRYAYYTVSTVESAARADVAAFRTWLLAEAARS